MVAVDLELGINAHDVLDEIEVAERHARLDGVGADAAVGAEHIVHIQLIHALFCLLLEGLGRRGEVRVLIAEELVRNLARQEHAHVRLLMDSLAAQVHAHARADGRDIIRPEQGDDLLQRVEHLPARHGDLRVLGADIVGDLAGIFQVDRVEIHADGKRADLLAEELGRDSTDEAGIQSAGEEEAERRVGVKPLLHAGDQLLADRAADGIEVVRGVLRDGREVGVAHELPVAVVVSRRERLDARAQADEVLRLAGKDDAAVLEIAVKQRADADGVARGDQAVLLRVVEDHRKLRVEHFKHLQPVLAVERQQDLAVGLTAEGILRGELRAQLAEAVDLAVADDHIAAEMERLHTLLAQAHDSEPVEAQPALARRLHTRLIRPA